MKNFKFYIALVGFLSFGLVNAQVNSNEIIQNNVAGSNVFMDASTNFNTSASSSQSLGKGMVFPTTDLNAFRFDIEAADGITLPSYFNGMIVYNVGTGSTADPLLSTQTSGLVEGFYYFSNPTGEIDGNITSGVWKRLGAESSTVKETVVRVVVGAGNASATLDLDTATATTTPTLISGSLLSSTSTFLEAKIYAGSNTTGELKLSATGNYAKTDNILTTGNGLVYQVLPAGTYTVVLSYK